MKLLILISLAAASCSASLLRHERRFPNDFVFGAATAAYQIEGAWNADGKGENIWDRVTHTKPEFIKDRSNGDVAADSYTHYKRDVEMLRELGVDAYRFSLSWSRILPNGLTNKVNEAGIAFYNNYIDEMLKYNITPMATLYHYDLPQRLQDYGGFLNSDFPIWFENYARLVYEKFGDRVKHWITFNEPREVCFNGYGDDSTAPMINATDVGTYYCAKHLVLAHARAYHAYTNLFKPSQGGVCGISLAVNWNGPLTDSEEDEFAAEMKRQADWGIIAEPIFSEEGGFPKELAEIVAKKSAEQGYPTSRMPSFTDQEREFVRGSSDFFGLNHYTATLISATLHKKNYPIPSLYADIDVGIYTPVEWEEAASSWLKRAPNSIYNSLTYMHKKYNGPVFYVTENGWSTISEVGYEDDGRVKYYRDALNNVLDCLHEGVDIRGYMAWSLMDNFEWTQGYLDRFGLYEVDFESEQKTRTPKKSAFVYKQIIKTRVIDPDYEPDTRTMWIDEGH